MKLHSSAGVALAIALLSSSSSSQLADLQPGRNFTATQTFGFTQTANIDIGDADLDGDMDVITGNGHDFSPGQLSRIFINQGFAQGGTLGAFLDETSTRFAGFPADCSRDIQFVDFDDDGDQDVYVANTKMGAGSAGAVSRFYVNLAGEQRGAAGFYQEETDTRWGTLVSVPLVQQVFGGNQGPWGDWAGDAAFGDLDDDGDLDLFHASTGPAIDGTRDSRIFLNDGDGVFDELWPWADPAADIKLHAFEVNLVDYEGDDDLDVFVASRNSQSRVYVNNLHDPVGATPFTDRTAQALIATGATQSGAQMYEVEYCDVDADGDFDSWVVNYEGNTDRLLRNGPGSPFAFTKVHAWIVGDPVKDEESMDFIDYDDDGDLDAFMASFEGTNWLYQSSLAQGWNPDSQGLYHRTGQGMSLAPELPSNFNGGTSSACAVGDTDSDGDLDILLGNESNQGNWLFRNVQGVPDTHAPALAAVTLQGDKLNGTETVIHAAVRDNAPYNLHAFYDASLVYSVDGDTPVGVPMFHQGGQQFRGVIPAQTDAAVEYHVEVTDLAGNTGVSATQSFTQSGADPWTDLGSGLAGLLGVPMLHGTGTLAAGSPGALLLSHARPSSICALFVSIASTPAPFKCGTLVPVPVAIQLTLVTSPAGAVPLAWGSWPSGLSGASLYFQYAIADGAAVCGTSLSNAVRGDVP